MAVKEDESLSLTDHEIDVEDVDDVRPAVTALKKESIDESETDQINRNRNLKNCSRGKNESCAEFTLYSTPLYRDDSKLSYF